MISFVKKFNSRFLPLMNLKEFEEYEKIYSKIQSLLYNALY